MNNENKSRYNILVHAKRICRNLFIPTKCIPNYSNGINNDSTTIGVGQKFNTNTINFQFLFDKIVTNRQPNHQNIINFGVDSMPDYDNNIPTSQKINVSTIDGSLKMKPEFLFERCSLNTEKKKYQNTINLGVDRMKIMSTNVIQVQLNKHIKEILVDINDERAIYVYLRFNDQNISDEDKRILWNKLENSIEKILSIENGFPSSILFQFSNVIMHNINKYNLLNLEDRKILFKRELEERGKYVYGLSIDIDMNFISKDEKTYNAQYKLSLEGDK
jgi:hypothetical protein